MFHHAVVVIGPSAPAAAALLLLLSVVELCGLLLGELELSGVGMVAPRVRCASFYGLCVDLSKARERSCRPLQNVCLV